VAEVIRSGHTNKLNLGGRTLTCQQV